jgi:hypothetical protein
MRGKIVDRKDSDYVIKTKNVHRACYVLTHNAPRSIFAKHTRKGYPELTLAEGREVLADRSVRLGAYGDPAAVPIKVWDRLLAYTASHTGYTHQWRRFSAIRRYCMASVETTAQARLAWSKGYRTFRVSAEPKLKNESICPASAEAGKKLTCAQCLACDGSSGRRGSIVIAPHGHGSKWIAA